MAVAKISARDFLFHVLERGPRHRLGVFREHVGARRYLRSYLDADPSFGKADSFELKPGAAPDALKVALRKMFDDIEAKLEAGGKTVLLGIVQAFESVLLDAGVIDILWDLLISLLKP